MCYLLLYIYVQSKIKQKVNGNDKIYSANIVIWRLAIIRKEQTVCLQCQCSQQTTPPIMDGAMHRKHYQQTINIISKTLLKQ